MDVKIEREEDEEERCTMSRIEEFRMWRPYPEVVAIFVPREYVKHAVELGDEFRTPAYIEIKDVEEHTILLDYISNTVKLGGFDKFEFKELVLGCKAVVRYLDLNGTFDTGLWLNTVALWASARNSDRDALISIELDLNPEVINSVGYEESLAEKDYGDFPCISDEGVLEVSMSHIESRFGKFIKDAVSDLLGEPSREVRGGMMKMLKLAIAGGELNLV